MSVIWAGVIKPYRRPPRGSWSMMTMPVESPLKSLPPPRPVELKERKSAGDPECPECKPRKACALHKDHHHKTNPLAGIG